MSFNGRTCFQTAACIVALTLAASLAAIASAQSQSSEANDAPSPASAPQQAVTNLSPIVVTGNKLYLPVVLQMIKAALKRPVSFSHENLNKLVCQFTGITGTHFHALDCRTNCQRWRQSMASQGVLVSSQLCDSGGSSPVVASPGQFAATVAGWTSRQRINPGALRTLLKKLPPADSSYTLQVMDHGKVVARYVFKNGELVSVWKAKSDKD